ncbi:MAG TPA: 3-dehydroquinate synthase [Pyrinomonadaceae bacterium]|nr:3-dehydroquinate synthase [Pyrinomonadaceae bacterium]
MSRVRVWTKAKRHQYDIRIGIGLLSQAGKLVRMSLGKEAQRIGLISNRKVFSLYGPTVEDSLKADGFAVAHWLMGDGERHKSPKTFAKALLFLSETKLERLDAVVSLGGGVVGDLAGFAAATYLRGVRFIQIPTTLLAQVDSSVGGKTGVNLPNGKNLVGSFHQPSTVIIDIQTLITLPSRELVAGWCECVKQGAVCGIKLLNDTTTFLKNSNQTKLEPSSQLEKLIASHCAFKASIVASDEREDPQRADRRSRKVLNFGHTIAHAIESVTNYKRFRHGEAVGYGMLVAAELSKNLGLANETELESLTKAVHLCGLLPSVKGLDQRDIVTAVGQDKKKKQGTVQWVLLEGIGRPRIVDGQKISQDILQKSVRKVFQSSNA